MIGRIGACHLLHLVPVALCRQVNPRTNVGLQRYVENCYDRTMTAFDAIAFDRGTDPILRLLTPEQVRAVVDYRGDEALRRRIDELAAKNTEGELTEPERSEYEGYVRANKFVAVLQAKARRMLSVNHPKL